MSEEKLVNFHLDAALYHQLKTLALRENRTIKDILKDEITDYVKVHGDGNPSYQISDFFEPDFNICPAVFRDSTAWKNYLEKRTPKELQEIKTQIIVIDKVLSKVL